MAKYLLKRHVARMNQVRAQATQSHAQPPIPWNYIFDLVQANGDTTDAALQASVEKLLSAPCDAREEVHRGLVGYLKHYTPGRNEVDDIVAVSLFNQICKHPGKSDLIFYSADYFDHHPSVEEVVALSLGDPPRDTNQEI